MDWMYKGVSGLVDKEEYLTGRRIDKTFEVIQASENPSAKGDLDAFEPSIPGSVLGANAVANTSSMVTIDLATKLREDPLYEIRVKQREQRKKLLNNPLKLKKLKTILESTLKDDIKHKKSKKKKKRRHSSSSSGDSESDSDHKSRKRHRKSEDRSDRKSRHSSERRHHQSNESHRDKDKYRDRRDSDRKYDQSLKKVRTDDSRIPKRLDDKPTDSKPKKLSAEEMEKKRKEMLNNAVWRECQRKSNVKSYAEEEEKEIQFNSSGKSAQFIKPLLKSATESDSLEGRIKQKRFRSQRGPDTMDKNFARR